MALFEYYCETCQDRFEQITSHTFEKEPGDEEGKCPKCQGKNTKKIISKFAVGGQGDLRESTQHGCHGCSGGGKHSH